jgi:predicted aminopeptidase
MKKAGLILAAIVIFFIFYYADEVVYGLRQAKGQLNIIWQAEAIDELVEKNYFPDSSLQKIREIQQIKTFTVEELGLDPSKSYESYYEQYGKPILWVVTAAPEFSLEPYRWEFPLAGEFAYKGFFSQDRALQEAKQLKEKGYDTEVGEVNAWSTLGYLADPILSSMLEYSRGRMAELIIHELTHGTLYLMDSTDFNENFASFVGEKGALMYLNQMGDEEALEEYLQSNERAERFRNLLQQTAASLDSLYSSFTPQNALLQKRKLKQQVFARFERKKNKLRKQYSHLQDADKEKMEINNATFSSYATYHESADYFERQLKEQFQGNLKAFIEYYKQL